MRLLITNKPFWLIRLDSSQSSWLLSKTPMWNWHPRAQRPGQARYFGFFFCLSFHSKAVSDLGIVLNAANEIGLRLKDGFDRIPDIDFKTLKPDVEPEPMPITEQDTYLFHKALDKYQPFETVVQKQLEESDQKGWEATPGESISLEEWRKIHPPPKKIEDSPIKFKIEEFGGYQHYLVVDND